MTQGLLFRQYIGARVHIFNSILYISLNLYISLSYSRHHLSPFPSPLSSPSSSPSPFPFEQTNISISTSQILKRGSWPSFGKGNWGNRPFITICESETDIKRRRQQKTSITVVVNYIRARGMVALLGKRTGLNGSDPRMTNLDSRSPAKLSLHRINELAYFAA